MHHPPWGKWNQYNAHRKCSAPLFSLFLFQMYTNRRKPKRMLGITLIGGEPGGEHRGSQVRQIYLDLQEPYMSC